jgi:hypothetical protein
MERRIAVQASSMRWRSRRRDGPSSAARYEATISRDEEPGSSVLNLYEFNSKFQPIGDNDGAVKVRLPGLAMIYDFAATENYAVFVQLVLGVNMGCST